MLTSLSVSSSKHLEARTPPFGGLGPDTVLGYCGFSWGNPKKSGHNGFGTMSEPGYCAKSAGVGTH